MFDNCKEISSFWHDSSSFNRLVAKVMNPQYKRRMLKSCGVCGERCPHFDTHISTDYVMEAGLHDRAELGSYFSWLIVLGFRERIPRFCLSRKCNPHQQTLQDTHIFTHDTSHALICTWSQNNRFKAAHIHQPSLKSFYHIIHMQNSHTDFGVIN